MHIAYLHKLNPALDTLMSPTLTADISELIEATSVS